MSFKGDSYTDEAEVKALDAQRQEDHDTRELSKAETAGATGQAYPDDPFYGTDPADVKARRHARGAYVEEDFEEPPADPVDDYRGPTSGDQVRTVEERDDYVNYRLNLSIEEHHDFMEIVKPVAREIGRELSEGKITEEELERWALERPDFAERLYQSGLELKNQNQLPENFKSMDGDSFREWLDNRHHHDKARGSGESESEFISRRETKRLNRITNPVDFGAELDRLKWRR